MLSLPTGAGGASHDVEKAVRLYYTVRDRFLYDPYSIQFTPEACKASAVIARGRGYCVAKAVVLAAAARRCRVRPQRRGEGGPGSASSFARGFIFPPEVLKCVLKRAGFNALSEGFKASAEGHHHVGLLK